MSTYDRGKGAALILPFADTRATLIHLNEISRHVAVRGHAVVLMDRAEDVWQNLRQNWLSNRVFEDHDAILDAGCNALNRLVAQPQVIIPIDMRVGTHKSH